jgi:hypothetical protein
MNIEALYDNIRQFEKEVVESGFLRDVSDYSTSLPNNQSNIVGLRDMADNLLTGLTRIYDSGLPSALRMLFPSEKPIPFTDTDYKELLSVLLENKEIEVNDFFNQFTQLINQLNSSLQSNLGEVNRLKDIFIPYVDKRIQEISAENKAIISLLFHDIETTSKLEVLSESLRRWNRNLLLYHQVLSSTSPSDIEIISVQNGSIDVILNIDLNIALNLVDLFKVAMSCYLGYLSYKTLIKPITDTFFGNKKLIEQEKKENQNYLII